MVFMNSIADICTKFIYLQMIFPLLLFMIYSFTFSNATSFWFTLPWNPCIMVTAALHTSAFVLITKFPLPSSKYSYYKIIWIYVHFTTYQHFICTGMIIFINRYFKPGTRPQLAKSQQWAHTWFPEIFFVKVCVLSTYVPVFVPKFALRWLLWWAVWVG